ncbi:DEAD/DEAH box helicase [Magnetospirillum sp. UT-4]|uniref:DEAD/DEAH box helicase n=1 Tax=Magnetospirillum sp. UT-4 TaxID=2681467 RepID=UPI001383C17B|nr:helicase-related protein [Magnetospirillum sp. UT-4]CAA7615799.1 Helicase domain protein [Magnetospirillum sp. UT-4]
MVETGAWRWSTDYRQVCRVIESETLWGKTFCRIWLTGRDAVVRVAAESLEPLDRPNSADADRITYLASAARVSEAVEHDTLLAPIAASVVPLPHQIKALSRAVADDRIRYLLADEVGLGKTIEAGLIIRELKLRGRVKRVLVLAPKGLVTQWVAEMKTHFDEDFHLLLPNDFPAYRRITGQDNIWAAFDQAIVPMDSVKPLDKRRGWSRDRVAEFNRDRFNDLISVGWDLVIVDESHRLGGSTDQVARFRLGQGLAEAAPYLLLLSATPHQGKTDNFHRLISLLDAKAFPNEGSVTRDRVAPYVIRTEKRNAVDGDGKPLFRPRRTQLLPVEWQPRHELQRQLYDAVTDYVRFGYNQALKQKKRHISFLMILMQRLVTSSTAAIRATLERRLEVLAAPDDQLSLFPMDEDDFADIDAQEALDALIQVRSANRNEKAEIQTLLDLAKRTEMNGSDVKAEALLDTIYRLQQEEADPSLKVLIFTEFVPTQAMLAAILGQQGFDVVTLNGSMDMDERKDVQRAFAERARVLISTDAGGEGLNLQFAHVVINFDMPWSPTRLEQRIGRVDRIGQKHTVRALNFTLKDTVEARVQEVLEEKLAVILDEFGVDKAGDVLDSSRADRLFDDMYVEAVLAPDQLDRLVDGLVDQVRGDAQAGRSAASILGDSQDIDPGEARRMMEHPLPHWVERMTVGYLRSQGGTADGDSRAWRLTWPEGEVWSKVAFTPVTAETPSDLLHVGLESERIRGLSMGLPRFAEGQPIPIIQLPGMSGDIHGVWSLWRVSVQALDWKRQRIVPLFVHHDGRVLGPTARHLWDRLLTDEVSVVGYVDNSDIEELMRRSRREAETHGRPVYDELLAAHRARLDKEAARNEYSFAARRKAIDAIGLPQVKAHRLAAFEQEQATWHQTLADMRQVVPSLDPLLVVRLG